MRIVLSFAVALTAVGALGLLAIDAWFARPGYEPVAAFLVEPADPELAAAARARGVSPSPAAAPTPPAPMSAYGRGFVQLRFDVLPDGRAVNIEVLGAAPAGRHDDQARATIEARRFVPDYEEGRPVVSSRTEIVEFTFEPE